MSDRTPVYVVWGDPENVAGRVAVRHDDLPPAAVALVPSGRYASVDLGFTVLAGPVISEPGSRDGLVVLADQSLPDWFDSARLSEAGWVESPALPDVVRAPFPVDLLVLATNWSGSLDGWSSTVWLDKPVRPLERVALEVSPISPTRLLVHVLETGADAHGVGFAVVFAPDRASLDRCGLSEHGWRSEPWVRVRRQSWIELSELSLSVETHVSVLLGHPIVRDVTVHDLVAMRSESLRFLPVDVREGLEQALIEMGD